MHINMANQILSIIGSTGNIGNELIDLLSDARSSVRAVLRNINKSRNLPSVAWIQADMENESLLDTVLAGTDRLFILTGNHPGFGQVQVRIIEAAERLGVKHVVKLSALGASPHTKSPLAHEHWLAEEALKKSGMSWTILRPHVFMQNWLGELAATVRAEGVIYAAIGEGKIPFIDARDIAAVAAKALLHPAKHSGKTYVLTGGEAIGYNTLAEALSKATGRPIMYKSLSMDEMRSRLESQGFKPNMIESYLALASYQKAGGATERISDDIVDVLNRPPRSAEQFAEDFKEIFR